MIKKIKNFEEMGQILQEQKKEKLNERFDEVVGDRIDKIPPGCQFKSELANIDSLSVVKQPDKKSLYAMVRYKNQKGKEKHQTFSVFADGTFSGAIPKDLKATREQIYGEMLDDLDRVGLDFWHEEKQEILSKPDWPVSKKEKRNLQKPPTSEDPRRIEYLRKQPDALFGFLGKDGFKDYYGVVFKNFVVLENPKCGNAAYFIDLPQSLSEEEQKMTLSHSGRDKLIEEYWKPYEGVGRWEMFTTKEEAERMVHLPINNWIPQMKNQLNRRNDIEDDRSVELLEERT